MQADDRVFAVIGGSVAVAAGVLMWLAGATPLNLPRGTTTTSTPRAHDVEPPAVPPTVLEPAVHREGALGTGGDGFVRAAFAGIARHPRLASWLLTDDLTERAVAAVAAVAAGRVPRQPLDFVEVERDFLVYEQHDRLWVAAGTSRRFAPVVEAALSIPADDLQAVLDELRPALETAWRESGRTGSFADGLRRATGHLLEVRIPDGPLEVERRSRWYEWADDELQGLSAAQKALLRMGPDHARRIQDRLREVTGVLEGPPDSDPGIGEPRQVAELEGLWPDTAPRQEPEAGQNRQPQVAAGAETTAVTSP